MNKRELTYELQKLSDEERAELAKLLLQGMSPEDLWMSVEWPAMLKQQIETYLEERNLKNSDADRNINPENGG
ncbi:MAG: hypothetical protein LAT57_09855 [Balneolales bacterium]|nr:hypothetical protein [Balneolales bacterium]